MTHRRSPWCPPRRSRGPDLPRRWRAPACLVAVLAASQLGATDCNGGIIRDPGFDLWCGEALCAWKVEHGSVRRTATWHEADSGVELVDADTAIEQFTPVDHLDGTCIRFDLISDVAETAQAELAVDIYGDGAIERTFPIPTARWRPVSYAFAVKPPFTGIRFQIAKRGPGHAAVARMRATVSKDGCAGLPELDGGPAPLGALCGVAGDCASGICAINDFFATLRCSGCDPGHSTCGTGQACGFADPGPPERGVPIACVPAAARTTGEQCVTNAECASGTCVGRICSTCLAKVGCGAVACAQSYPVGPYLCGAGAHAAQRGAPCGRNEDCASGACAGPPRLQCTDGRACATDANCPVDENLVPGPCTMVGVQGGSCT